MISDRESELRRELAKLIKNHPDEDVLDDLINEIADAAYAYGISCGIEFDESVEELFDECD